MNEEKQIILCWPVDLFFHSPRLEEKRKEKDSRAVGMEKRLEFLSLLRAGFPFFSYFLCRSEEDVQELEEKAFQKNFIEDGSRGTHVSFSFFLPRE